MERNKYPSEPIISIATAPGRGAVGVVRLSADSLESFVAALLRRRLTPRMATLCTLEDAQGARLDEGLALYFPAPHSYTGEDVLELQVHGGPVVQTLIVQRCLQLAVTLGLPMRLARAGEFTQRAFLNGKLDLLQAEAVADLIGAATATAARSAARSLSGEFSAAIRTLGEQLTYLRMLVEATLDFPEEEDVDTLQQADALGLLGSLQSLLQTVLAKSRQGALLREGLKLVIAGEPNVGKSSLLNALAGADVAIVTPVAGTTRDVVQQTIEIEGIPIRVLDTAGLRTTASDVVEELGIARAWQHIGEADVVVLMHDASLPQEAPQRLLDAQLRSRLPTGCTVIEVHNKIDLLAHSPHAPGQAGSKPPTAADDTTLPQGVGHCVALSVKTGEGLPALRHTLAQVAGWAAHSEGVFLARTRHVQALLEVASHLQTAYTHLQDGSAALDILAEELRLAQNALGTITGECSADDLLEKIFSEFCIGK